MKAVEEAGRETESGWIIVNNGFFYISFFEISRSS